MSLEMTFRILYVFQLCKGGAKAAERQYVLGNIILVMRTGTFTATMCAIFLPSNPSRPL